MTLEVWFWIFMALWLFFGLWRARAEAAPYPIVGGHLLQFLLFVIVGWKIFGSPVQ